MKDMPMPTVTINENGTYEWIMGYSGFKTENEAYNHAREFIHDRVKAGQDAELVEQLRNRSVSEQVEQLESELRYIKHMMSTGRI